MSSSTIATTAVKSVANATAPTIVIRSPSCDIIDTCTAPARPATTDSNTASAVPVTTGQTIVGQVSAGRYCPADESFCQREKEFPSVSVHEANQPCPGTGALSSALPPSS